jgi:hypothetical protein
MSEWFIVDIRKGAWNLASPDPWVGLKVSIFNLP